MASVISNVAEEVGDAFLVLAIVGVAITAIFGTVSGMDFLTGNETWDETLAGQLETEVNDGMIAVAGLLILMVVIVIIRMVRTRSAK